MMHTYTDCLKKTQAENQSWIDMPGALAYARVFHVSGLNINLHPPLSEKGLQ